MIATCRSTRSEVFCGKGVLKDFAKLTDTFVSKSLLNKVPLTQAAKRDSDTSTFL